MSNYPISPEDCFIVRTLKDADSIRDAARILNCDAGGLLRKVHRIADDHDLLTKMEGKWVLTKKGMAISNWVEETLLSQQKALTSKTNLRIGTTNWYSDQLIIPGFKNLKKALPNVGEIQILTPEKPELALLNYEIDFNITCYVPHDPQIAYKKIIKEKWVIVIPLDWLEELKNISHTEILNTLSQKTFIGHQDLSMNQIFPQMTNTVKDFLIVDHLVGVRSALLNGLGWSCVPELLLKDTYFKQKVAKLELETNIQHELCLSWVRNRNDVKELAPKMTKWLLGECRVRASLTQADNA